MADSTREPRPTPSIALLAACGAAAAGALLWLAPGRFDAERWSLHDPLWRQAAIALTAAYAVVLLLFTLRVRPRHGLFALLLPPALAAPGTAAKAWATDPSALRAEPLPLLMVLVPLLAAALLAPVGLGRARGRRAAPVAAWLGLLGVLLWAGLRYGELAAQEAILTGGGAETALRALAARVGEDLYEHPPPAGDAEAWLRERLRVEGWQARGDLVYWAPHPGVGPGPLRLRYRPSAADASPWEVVLESEAVPLLRPDARPLKAAISVDGMLDWSWPEGPPPEVERRRRALEQQAGGAGVEGAPQ